MSKVCPIYGKAIYADCLECDDKLCKKDKKKPYKEVVIGIDQSYKNTGISVTADGVLLKVKSKHLEKYKNNSEKRTALRKTLTAVLKSVVPKAEKVICVIERIRLVSQKFLNINYIKSIGALNALIVDVMYEYGVEVFSVDTRCWKSQIIGTSKPSESPKFAMEPEKYPTYLWLSKVQGGTFVSDVMMDMTKTKQKKNIFMINDRKYKINDDACDSAAISMFWFKGDRSKLKEEK